MSLRSSTVQRGSRHADGAATRRAGRPSRGSADWRPHERRRQRSAWIWSDQYDLKLLIVGLNLDYDHALVRGDPANRAFSCCYLRHGELLAIDCVNNPKDYIAAKKLIAERARFDVAKLADRGVSMKDAVLSWA